MAPHDVTSPNLAPPHLQTINPDADPNRPVASQIARPVSPPDTPGSVSPVATDKSLARDMSTIRGEQVVRADDGEREERREREHSFGGQLEGLSVRGAIPSSARVQDFGGTTERNPVELEEAATSSSTKGASLNDLPDSISFDSLASSSTFASEEGPETPKTSKFSASSTMGPRVIDSSASSDSIHSMNGLGVLNHGKVTGFGDGKIVPVQQLDIPGGLSATEPTVFSSAVASSSSPTTTPKSTGRRSPNPTGGPSNSPANLTTPHHTPRRLSSPGLSVPISSSNGQTQDLLARSPSPTTRRTFAKSPDKSEFNASSFSAEGGATGAISLGSSVVTPRKSSESRHVVGPGTKSPSTVMMANTGGGGSGFVPPAYDAINGGSYLNEKGIAVGRKESHPSLSNDPYASSSASDSGFGTNGYPSEKTSFVSHSHADSAASSQSQLHHHLHHPLTSVPTATTIKPGLTDSTAYWLVLYFAFTLSLTLFNKLVLNGFPFPWTLTGLHALSGSAGCYIALERGAFVPARLTSSETMTLAAFSMLYTINIAVSSMSAALVTVPFHQVVRSTTPLFTIIISATFFNGKFGIRKLVSLLPVVAGVGFATYGDIYFTAWGLILTLLGTFLAALKTVITNVIQTGGGGRLRLHPLDLLMRMSPLAFIQCVIGAYLSGELERVREFGATKMTRGKAVALLINGIIAFGLNIVSFTANKKAGPLTMTVSANCKQVLTIVLSVVMFNIPIAPMNALGILLTLFGGAWYAYIEYAEKSVKRLGRIMEKP